MSVSFAKRTTGRSTCPDKAEQRPAKTEDRRARGETIMQSDLTDVRRRGLGLLRLGARWTATEPGVQPTYAGRVGGQYTLSRLPSSVWCQNPRKDRIFRPAGASRNEQSVVDAAGHPSIHRRFGDRIVMPLCNTASKNSLAT
jgi:hypothetical protein